MVEFKTPSDSFVDNDWIVTLLPSGRFKAWRKKSESVSLNLPGASGWMCANKQIARPALPSCKSVSKSKSKVISVSSGSVVQGEISETGFSLFTMSSVAVNVTAMVLWEIEGEY